MKRLDLFSEPFAKTGNIAADGYRKLLGSPAQDLLQTVLREAIQNSVDASRLGCGPSLLIRVRTLSAEQLLTLRKQVLNDLPREDQTRNDMAVSLEKHDFKVLEICDFHSTGLGGPTSADVATNGTEALDFVNFLRNVGVARDTYHGGGTYGYGKTSLYAMSACSTILVDSQTTYKGKAVRRFMGCHLGSAFDAPTTNGKRKRFTGRHWWGLHDGDDGIDPITGRTAAQIATSLGLPIREPDNTGTSIMILDPHIEQNDEARPIDHYILETILWNFWPRLTASTPREKKLSIRLEIEGRDVPLPTPETFPPLDLFASAIECCREGRDVEVIKSDKPKRDLGKLVIKRGHCANRSGPALDENSIIPQQTRHIALMRPVELVVKYVEGNPFADARFEWAGVFICSEDDEVESAFARSEPPTHDDWVPNNLSDRNAKIFVKGAMRRIESAAGSYGTPITLINNAEGERGPSLAGTAARLGRLLDSVSGKGPGKPKPPPHTPSMKKELSISPPRFIRLEIDKKNRRCAVFEAELRNNEANKLLQLEAKPHLVVDGAKADNDDLPAGYETTVIGISFESTGEFTDKSVINIGTQSGTIKIFVLSPPTAAVGLSLRFVNGEEE